jgi:hypothetical protein
MLARLASFLSRRGAAHLALVLALPVAVGAQSVSGVVVDSGTGRPLEEFTIHLMNARDMSVASALSRAGGRFALKAPEPGAYSLRVMRIGYRRAQTAPFPLRADEAVERRVAVVQIPVTLTAVRVEDTRECDIGIDEGSGVVATVWNQVQTAVQAVRLTQATSMMMTVRDRFRELTPEGRPLGGRTALRSGTSLAPYQSRDPAVLLERGFVERDDGHVTYFAPDARLLLSDAFVATHCFRLRNESRATASLIGVEFTPLATRQVADIRGTLWVDRQSSELRTMEFVYTGLPRAARDHEFGGHVSFQHVPGGSWIITSWQVRAPVYQERTRAVGPTASIALGRGAMRPMIDSSVARIVEEGGDVLSVRDGGGALVWASASGRLPWLEREGDTRGTIASARAEMRIPVAAADSVSVVATASAQCAAVRAQRERELAQTFAVPPERWAPTGPDSATQATALRTAATVLLGIADTTGRVEMTSVRAVRRGPPATYREAMSAIRTLRRPLLEPLPGCPVRQLVVLPYEVKTDR